MGEGKEKQSTVTTLDGNTLYVGGNGTGNYTKIQDAIDDSSDGDTVFVYNGTYYENVEVDKSINLIGEGKNTTIIYGSWSGYVLSIVVDWVIISGFAIQGEANNGIDILSKHNTITGNNISNFDFVGILSFNPDNDPCGNNIITENIISYNWDGIYIVYPSENNIIKDNKLISNSRYGIYLGYSDNNDISGNTFFNDGLFIEYPHFCDNKVDNNTVNGKPLVYLEDESDKIIDNEAGQVILVNCDNIIAENLNLSDTTVGIELLKTYNCTIKNNDCSNNYYGIYSSGSSGNNINGNKIASNNRHGIHFSSSSGNNITGNNIISNKRSGVFSYNSDGNNITGNNIITNNGDGIFLAYSDDNNITGNNITSNSWGISSCESSRNNITGNNITNNSNGIYSIDSSRNNITGNNIISNDKHGIYLYYYSKNTIITGNNISNNYFGIFFEYSSKNNIITGNNIISNNGGGIYLDGSSGNTITGNNIISNNDYGINSYSSNGNNIIYHNNFIENTINAKDSGNNIWDDGEFGNYWSDYKEKYPFARKIWSKGIWNTPYEIRDGDNQDNCPLIKQWPDSTSKSMLKNKIYYNPLMLRLLERFPNAFPILRYILELK